MTPREIEEARKITAAQRRQRQLKAQQKETIFKKNPVKK